jgi:outer membrane protein assembly factor BamB
MRSAAWFALGLFAVACSSKSVQESSTTVVAGSDGGSASTGTSVDVGPSDAGIPDAGPGPLGGGDWGQYRHDQRGQSENPATFAASEAASLMKLWQQDLGDQGASYVYTQAMITSDMVIFTTAASGMVVAVETGTGKLLWSRPLNSSIDTTCGGSKKPGFWAAAAVVGDVIYVASPDGNVYALRKSDGSTIWSAKVADPTGAGHGEFIQSSPAVSTKLGRLYVGVASSAHCDPVAGRFAAVDLASGAVQQMPLVGPGQQGSSVWSSIAVAEDEDRLYITTGNRVGPLEATQNSQAFLAVDPHSLHVLDHWQDPTPLENSDFGSSPALAEGGGMKLVAATNKDGWLYVLRRDALSAGPVWKYQMAVIDPAQPTLGGDPTGGWGSISTPAFAHGRLYAEPAARSRFSMQPQARWCAASLALAQVRPAQ